MTQFNHPALGLTYLITEQTISGIPYLVHGLAGQAMTYDVYAMEEDRAEDRLEKVGDFLATGWHLVLG